MGETSDSSARRRRVFVVRTALLDGGDGEIDREALDDLAGDLELKLGVEQGEDGEALGDRRLKPIGEPGCWLGVMPGSSLRYCIIGAPTVLVEIQRTSDRL